MLFLHGGEHVRWDWTHVRWNWNEPLKCKVGGDWNEHRKIRNSEGWIEVLDLHKSGNEISLDLHKSGNELSLDLQKSSNELSSDLHKSGNELSLDLHFNESSKWNSSLFDFCLCFEMLEDSHLFPTFVEKKQFRKTIEMQTSIWNLPPVLSPNKTLIRFF